MKYLERECDIYKLAPATNTVKAPTISAILQFIELLLLKRA